MQQCRLSSWPKKRAGTFYTETSTIAVRVPRVSCSMKTKRRSLQKNKCCDIGTKNNIKILIIPLIIFIFNVWNAFLVNFLSVFPQGQTFLVSSPLLPKLMTCSSLNYVQFYIFFPPSKALIFGLTFSADHFSWVCSAYLLAKCSSFSGRAMLEKV